MKITTLLWGVLLAASVTLRGVESVPGVRGKAVNLNGDLAYLCAPSLKPFDFTKGISVSFWIKGNVWTAEGGIISNIGDTIISKRFDSPGSGFYFNSRIGRKPGAILWAPKCFHAPLNKWVNIAFTYDTQTRRATSYCDGKPCTVWDVGKTYPGRASYQLSGKLYKALPFRIGTGTKGSFDGALDEIFIYDRPLTPQEMAQVHKGKLLPGLQAAYLFDDPADVGKDSSHNKRHLVKKTGLLAQKVPRIGSKIKTKVIVSDKKMAVWSRNAVEKTFKYDQIVNTGTTTAIAAELAKNEYESFQLVLSPAQVLKNVKVTLSDFTFNGHKLVTQLHQVGYVKIFKNSALAVTTRGTVFGEAATMFEQIINHGPGEYPDPLPPAKVLLTASPDQSYAYWVTVKSNASTPAGIYTARAIITADGNYKMTVPLKVKVRNFTLPEVFNSHNSAVMGYRISKGNRANFHRVASEHHVTLSPLTKDPVITFDAKGNMKVDTTEFDKEAAEAVKKYRANTIYFPGWGFYQLPRDYNLSQTWCGIPVSKAPGKLTAEFKEKFGRYLEYMSKHLKKKNLLQYTRISMVDEPHTAADYALCQEFAALVRRHAPEVKTLVTKWPMKPLLGAPDIWCLGMIIPADIKAAIARGETFEWYPNWHFVIDRPLMDSRMLGFMMYKFHIRGILYFNMCHGWDNPELVRMNPAYTYPNGRVLHGLGLMIYPPEKKNAPPLSSLRFVMCRDAYEDYEYFLIADKLIKKIKDPVRAAAAAKLLKDACDAIVPAYEADPSPNGGWKKTKWETDGNKLLVWRKKIADLIESLQK